MENQIEIRHAGRDREFSHPAFGRVDGYHAPSNSILEYMGCHWHSCIRCYSAYFSGKQLINKDSNLVRRRREDTLAKNRMIVVCIKNCYFFYVMNVQKIVNKLFANIALNSVSSQEHGYWMSSSLPLLKAMRL